MLSCIKIDNTVNTYLQKERSQSTMKKSKKKLILIIAIIIVILLVVISVARCALSAAANIEEGGFMLGDGGCLVEPLQKHDLSASISVSGTIESQHVLSVTSDLTYKIAELNVQAGDYVNEGDILCVFDSSDLDAQIKTLEDQLSKSSTLDKKQAEINARALKNAKEEQSNQLSQANRTIEAAQRELDAARTAQASLEESLQNCQSQINNLNAAMRQTLQNEGESDYYMQMQQQLSELSLSANDLQAQIKEASQTVNACQSQLEDANLNYSSVQTATNQQIQSCQDAIDTQGLSDDNSAATKELNELKRKKEKITVKAEQSGLITSINVSVGSIHNGGELMVIQDTSALKLTVSIKEADILNIKEGMEAIVTSSSNEDLELKGTVSKVVNFISSSSNMGSMEGVSSSAGYSAEISLGGDSGLLLGMSAKAKILLSNEGKKMSVPYESIMKDGDDAYVYRAVPTDGKKYKIERVDVSVGLDSDYYTEISSDELQLEDYIVCYPDTVLEGDVVAIDETYLSEEDAQSNEGGE